MPILEEVGPYPFPEKPTYETVFQLLERVADKNESMTTMGRRIGISHDSLAYHLAHLLSTELVLPIENNRFALTGKGRECLDSFRQIKRALTLGPHAPTWILSSRQEQWLGP
jgi:predicted transcriptional regulator